MKIVAIHGIAQEQLGRRQIENAWIAALTDGIELAGGLPVPDVNLRVAFYGDLFLGTEPAGVKSSSSEPVEPDGTAEDLDFIRDCLTESITDDEVAQLEHDQVEPDKGFRRSPKAILELMRLLDRRLGPGAARFFIGTLRQARQYIVDPGLRDEINRRVTDAVSPDTSLLVGHSLGSVVALEFIRRNRQFQVPRLITLGSPLGLHAIQRSLDQPWYGSDGGAGVPTGLRSWHNIRDERDPVACAGPLATHWSGITELLVNNGNEPHTVVLYGTWERGQLVRPFYPIRNPDQFSDHCSRSYRRRDTPAACGRDRYEGL